MSPRTAVLCAALLVAAPAHAQFGDLLNRAQRTAADAAEKAARDAAKPAPAAQPAKAAPASTPAADATQAGGSTPAPASTGGAAQPPAGEVYGNRYDFVPGDKVLVYDDFSDTDVGEYPAKWTIKDGGGNAIEVVQVGDRRFLKTRYQKDHQDSAFTWLRYEVKGDMPKNFTIEFDMDVDGNLGVIVARGPDSAARRSTSIRVGTRT